AGGWGRVALSKTGHDLRAGAARELRMDHRHGSNCRIGVCGFMGVMAQACDAEQPAYSLRREFGPECDWKRKFDSRSFTRWNPHRLFRSQPRWKSAVGYQIARSSSDYDAARHRRRHGAILLAGWAMGGLFR